MHPEADFQIQWNFWRNWYVTCCINHCFYTVYRLCVKKVLNDHKPWTMNTSNAARREVIFVLHGEPHSYFIDCRWDQWVFNALDGYQTANFTKKLLNFIIWVNLFLKYTHIYVTNNTVVLTVK
jgi:hypothetical protein